MATIDKQSVREEFDRIKLEFNKLVAANKVPKETELLFNNMFMLFNLLIAIFLEKLTTKNSKNSSKPSSQTTKDTSATNAGSNGKGPKEKKTTINNTRTVEKVTLIEVNQCDICGADLRQTSCSHHERRTKIDVIFEKVVEHTDIEVKTCPNCKVEVKGDFPKDLPGPLQYGNGLKAFIINLLICQMVSLNRVQKLVKSMIGQVIAEATLLTVILKLHEVLAVWETKAIAEILTNTAMNVDETSIRVNKKNQWLHVYSAGNITIKFLHKNRGTEAIEAINIIPRYNGTIIHDCWSSYLSYEHCSHGLCGSHLLRELTHAIEANNYKWAANIKRLLLATCKVVSRRASKKITIQEYANLQKRYRTILTKGKSELPVILDKPNGKRGKIAKSDAHNLWERLKKYEDAVLLFAKRADVSFTNNRAERDLRMSKVKQKVSGCFRSEIYAHAFCRISSYLQTMAAKGYNPLIAIQRALTGKFV